jgi:hypothetical protein
MDEAVIQTDDDYAEKLVVTAATQLTSAATLIDSATRSQLEWQRRSKLSLRRVS